MASVEDSIWVPGTPVLLLTIGPALLLLMGFFMNIAKSRAGMRTTLRRELAARGVGVCINCAYDLTLNTSGVCPECGLAIPRDLEPYDVVPNDPDADLFDEGSSPLDR